jgi:hypothetical protein
MENGTIHSCHTMAQSLSANQARPNWPSPFTGLLAAHAARALPVHVLRVVTYGPRSQSAHLGAVADGPSMAETWQGWRGNVLGTLAYAPLHMELEGRAGKGFPIGEVFGVADEGGVKEYIWHGVEETLLGGVP